MLRSPGRSLTSRASLGGRGRSLNLLTPVKLSTHSRTVSVDDVMEALQASGHTCAVVVNCPFNGAEHHMNAQLQLMCFLFVFRSVSCCSCLYSSCLWSLLIGWCWVTPDDSRKLVPPDASETRSSWRTTSGTREGTESEPGQVHREPDLCTVKPNSTCY